MRRIRAGLLATLGVVIAALVATMGAVPASATSTRDDAIAPVQAIPADSVVDSYGVGIHLNFQNTPYRDADAVAAALADLGVRHVRDDLYTEADDPYASRQYAAIATVAREAGVRFDLIMGRPTSAATPADYVRTVADRLPAGAVESLEGVNEWDLFGGDDWVAEMKDWQKRLYTAAKANPATADLPVLSPALAFRWNYAEAGDLSQYADVANAHMYPGGYEPSNEIGRIAAAVRESVPDKPLVVTEAGYHNAMDTSNGHLPVPEAVAGVYLPRLLLEHVLPERHEERVYSYELIDEFADPEQTNPEAHFGLLRHDLSPKPAYTAMKTLLGLLSDPGPSFTPGTLAITADGLPNDAHYLLTQKRDGRFVLLLWRDVRIYDPKKQESLQVTPADVTLRLGEARDLTVYRPSDGPGPVSEARGSSLTLPLDGEVTAVTIDPTRPPEPTDVTATRGDRSATVSWRLPTTSAKLTGFEISRTPGGATTVVPADARSYRDTGLVNGRSYTYTVRAVGDGESSAAVPAPPVVPATVPTAPGTVSVSPGRRAVTVTWTKAGPRGRPVTAYRLVCRGRVLSVDPQEHRIGPGRYRATISGLPPDATVRVGVRARNEIGWGPAARSGFVTTARAEH